MICIYHSRDLDGWTSAAIVKNKNPQAELIGYDYGQPIPTIPDDSDVVMVDISFPMNEMVLLSKRVNLCWIDHHISAINEYNALPEEDKWNAYLENDIAACELTYYYYNPNLLFHKHAFPLGIKLLGEYDTWRKSDLERWESFVLPYQYAMRNRCSSPDDINIDWLLNRHEIYKVVDEGRAILNYQRKQYSLQAKSAFELDFNGLKAIAINAGYCNSMIFDSVYDSTKHDIMLTFSFNGDRWYCSLYSTKDDIDCSIIAKSYGGGGHKKASGFQATNLNQIFQNSNKEVS